MNSSLASIILKLTYYQRIVNIIINNDYEIIKLIDTINNCLNSRVVRKVIIHEMDQTVNRLRRVDTNIYSIIRLYEWQARYRSYKSSEIGG